LINLTMGIIKFLNCTAGHAVLFLQLYIGPDISPDLYIAFQ